MYKRYNNMSTYPASSGAHAATTTTTTTTTTAATTPATTATTTTTTTPATTAITTSAVQDMSSIVAAEIDEKNGIPWKFMNNEWYRLLSFVKFPIDSPVSTIILASKGFAYFVYESGGMIICYFCKSSLKTFNDMARIDEEHERLGPDCPMVKGTCSNNISMEQQYPHTDAGDILSKLFASRHPEQQNSSQQEQPEDSSNAGDENSGDATSYEKVGVITARPKRVEKVIFMTRRLNSFNEGPEDHYMEPDDDILSLASRQNENRMKQLHASSATPLSKDDNSIEVRSSQPSDESAPFVLVTNVSDIAESDSQVQDPGQSRQQSPVLEDTASPQYQETVPSQPSNVPQSTITGDAEAVQSSSTVKLGIRIVRPKHVEYALYTRPLDSFNEWPKDHHMKPEDLAKAGYFYTGDSEAAKARNFPKKEGSKNLGSDSASIRTGGNVERDKETIERLRNENNERRSQILCKICMDKEVAVVFFPCGHFVSCYECSCAMSKCPVCRLSIKGMVRAYDG